MREIKFKVWDKKRKRMGKVLNLVFADDGIVGGDVDFGGKMSEDVFGGCKYLEYTGLKDKDGKEIYEGDIVDCYRHGYEDRYKVRVEIEDIRRLPDELGGSNLSHRIVVGNIYSDEAV